MRGNVIDISPKPSRPDSVRTRYDAELGALTGSLRFSPTAPTPFRARESG